MQQAADCVFEHLAVISDHCPPLADIASRQSCIVFGIMAVVINILARTRASTGLVHDPQEECHGLGERSGKKWPRGVEPDFLQRSSHDFAKAS